jgi:hypothetical protein
MVSEIRLRGPRVPNWGWLLIQPGKKTNESACVAAMEMTEASRPATSSVS